MTFIATEQSIEDAQPIELYEFVGSAATYRLTSYQDNITFSSNLYTASAIQRSTVGNSSTLDFPEVTIDIPVSEQIVQDYAFGTPPEKLRLTITVLHGVGGDNAVIWSGFIDGITVQREVASFRLSFRLDNALDLTVPRPKFQGPCNHRLYNTECALSEAAFTFSTSVVSIDEVTLVATSVDSNPDQFYRNGGVENATTGERKLVIAQVGTTLTLISPFRTLAALDGINLIAGCDRSRATCRNKFDNVVNYGGFPDIPVSNDIFVNGLSVLIRNRGRT